MNKAIDASKNLSMQRPQLFCNQGFHIKFHDFIYALSDNPLIAPAMQVQWTNTQRVMGEVLMRDETPRDIWDQHEALLKAVMAGDGEAAEALARQHITQAADFMINRLLATEPSFD